MQTDVTNVAIHEAYRHLATINVQHRRDNSFPLAATSSATNQSLALVPGAMSGNSNGESFQVYQRHPRKEVSLHPMVDAYLARYPHRQHTEYPLRRFLQWLVSRPPFQGRPYTTVPVQYLTKELVSDYAHELDELLKGKQLKLGSVERYKYGLRCWLSFLRSQGHIDDNYADLISVKKAPPKSSIRIFELDQLEQILRMAQVRTTKRVFTAFCLAASTAVRSCELARLSIDDIDLEDKTIRYIGKRNIERTIPLPDVLLPIVKDYLNTRPPSASNAFL